MKGNMKFGALGLLIALALVAIVGTAACKRGGDPVRETMDAIERAAEETDAGAVVTRVAPEFQGADGSGRADAEAILRRYFAAYENLDVQVSDLTIERAEGAARARFRAMLSGAPRKVGGLEGLLPRQSSWRFDVRLAPDSEGRWLVTWAAWEPEG